MVLDEKPDLLGEITTKKVRPRYRALVNAATGDKAIREARVEASVSARGDPDKWIGGTHAPVERFTPDICFKSGAQKADVAFVDFGDTGDRRGCIGEGFGGNPLRRQHLVRHRRALVGCHPYNPAGKRGPDPAHALSASDRRTGQRPSLTPFAAHLGGPSHVCSCAGCWTTGNDETLGRLSWPASKKRQGTKSRKSDIR